MVLNNCRLWSFAALLIFFASTPLHSQEKKANERVILVFNPNNEIVRGRLISVENNVIVVRTENGKETISFDDISRIILAGDDKKTGKGILYGALVGGYAAFAALSMTDNPLGFLDQEAVSTRQLLIIVVPFICAGAGLGALIESGLGSSEERFEFFGTESERMAERKRLKEILYEETAEHRVHFVVQASELFPSVLKDDGSPSTRDWGMYRNLTNFNILRKVQVTYSLWPEFEVGVAALWFGEVPQNRHTYELFPSGGSRRTDRLQSFDAVGGYVIGVCRPFRRFVDNRFDIAVGAGVGAAAIEYARERRITQTTVVNNIYSTSSQQSSFAYSENLVSGVLYGQFSINLDSRLSLGLIVDYVMAPSKTDPADSLFNVPEQTLKFGNASVGLTVGFHF